VYALSVLLRGRVPFGGDHGVNENDSGHQRGIVCREEGHCESAEDGKYKILDGAEKPNWYGFGRIAEQYGESEVATSDYNQVKKPKKPAQVPGSSYQLAQNRLAAMSDSK
jgi:hypothetical protein